MTFQTLEQFFSTLHTRHTPALLWYSQPGERIELSGRVLENWVSKTANFLVDECEIQAGDSLALGMQTHWRSIVIALAALRTGAQIHLSGIEGNGEVAFSFEAESFEGVEIDYPVLVDRGPLSPRYMGHLPAGAVDYCAEVRSHGDVYSQFEIPVPENPALTGERTEWLTYQRVVAMAEETAHTLARQKAPSLYFPAPENLASNYLIHLLGVLAAGRGFVLLDPSLPWPRERVQKILAEEQAAEVSLGEGGKLS